MAALKLLLLSTEFPPGPGGIGTHAYQLARQLARRGWRLSVVTPQDYAAETEIAAWNARRGFRVARLPKVRFRPRQALARRRVLERELDALDPDLLVASGDPAVYLGAWVARRRGLPIAAVEHGRLPPRWERPIKRRAFGAVDHVVAVSAFSMTRLLALGVRPRARSVIHNGADAERFGARDDGRAAELRRRWAAADAPVLLTVGNVTERKGQDVVIRALPRVLETVPGVRYLIAGLPTRQPELETLARRLGVAENVRFLGRVDADELPALYRACDLFVMTSRHTPEEFEGFGIAAIEAALCGRPAVVTAGSGLAEAVRDGETGRTVPLEDPEATAEALVELLADPARRARMGEAARRRALAEQTWERAADAYERLFRNLVARAGG